MKVLESLCKFCAILAGVLLTAITLYTCYDILSRELMGKSIQGGYELAGYVAAAAIALFMPLCQLRRGHIIVDFFTTKCSDQTNAMLDRLGSLLLAIIFAVLAWRTTLGGLSDFQNNTGSQIMNFPNWVVYAFMVPPLALTAVVAFVQTFARRPDSQQGAAA